MATIKGYSVAKSQKGFGSAVNSSTVYSLSSENQAANQALNDAYGRTDTAQMLEGKVPTLKIGGLPGGTNLTGVVNTGATHDCLTNTNVVAGTARTDLANQTVIATTTTITSANEEAAGLVLSVPVTSAGAIDRANVRAVIGGEDYTDNDTISVDGWIGSRFEVDVAP